MVLARVPGGKGHDFEEALRAYFSQAGYFVVRGVPYDIEAEYVTDIDLWLYERPAALTRRRLIVDAKNRGKPKAAERIIWSSGLRAVLGVDGAIVATTDNRITTKALAKSAGVILLAGDAVAKLAHSDLLKKTSRLTSEEFNGAIKRIDEARRSSDWRKHLREARRTLIDSFGVTSANANLMHARFFAEQAVSAQPETVQAQFAVRLFYLTSALAVISLDFALSDQAFRSPEQRRQSIIDGVRFGTAEGSSAVPTIRAAIGLARQYADNGTAVAKQIEHGLYTDAARIPAEIIADYISRISASDSLFNSAREIENASAMIELPSFDALTLDARSLLGAFLDYCGVSREKLATAWRRRDPTSGGGAQVSYTIVEPTLTVEPKLALSNFTVVHEHADLIDGVLIHCFAGRALILVFIPRAAIDDYFHRTDLTPRQRNLLIDRHLHLLVPVITTKYSRGEVETYPGPAGLSYPRVVLTLADLGQTAERMSDGVLEMAARAGYQRA